MVVQDTQRPIFSAGPGVPVLFMPSTALQACAGLASQNSYLGEPLFFTHSEAS